jgi:hypothetical protein
MSLIAYRGGGGGTPTPWGPPLSSPSLPLSSLSISSSLAPLGFVSLDDGVLDDHEQPLEVAPEGGGVEHVNQALGEEMANPSGGVAHGRGDGVADERHEIFADGADHAEPSETFRTSESAQEGGGGEEGIE